MASTSKGAARIVLSLEDQGGSISFLRKSFPRAALVNDFHMNAELVSAIEGILERGPNRALPALDISCTPFQMQVLETIARIPYGETRTYGEVGSMAGRPKAARAVGQVMGKNPLPIVFP